MTFQIFSDLPAGREWEWEDAETLMGIGITGNTWQNVFVKRRNNFVSFRNFVGCNFWRTTFPQERFEEIFSRKHYKIVVQSVLEKNQLLFKTN